ncbi:MAG: hydrogenase maturation protease [Firmicutes bacterium]|nr:hydrogenase maturation protease [Bacillota bacterium]
MICRTMSNMRKIIVIGFGNILMSDDGAGICVIKRLSEYSSLENVQLIDGGVASFEALDAVRLADHIIVIDALAGGGVPGDIYRLTDENMTEDASSLPLSLHDGTLLQSLKLARCAGSMPPVTIYGIEPGNLSFGMTLTPAVMNAVDRLTDILAAELADGHPIIARKEE